jgi:anti-sigma factor RsiW
MHLYIDGELPPAEVLEFEKHLMECPGCRTQYERLRTVVDLIRGAKPLYDAPESSRVKAYSLVRRREATDTWLRMAAAVLVAAGLGLSAWLLARPVTPAHFPEFAADVHRQYAAARTRLGITSSKPEAVSAWLQSRVDFPLELPDYPVGPGGRKLYGLVGAGLLQYAGERVAYVAYEMDHQPISLLMASTPQAAPSGGDVYRSGKLTFRFFDRQGLKVITWTDRGIHYGLVSEMGARGAESCVICHGREGDRRVIEELKPGRRE